MTERYKLSSTWVADVQEAAIGKLSPAENSSYANSTINWENTEQLIRRSANAGQVFSNPIAATYSLSLIHI